MKVTFKKYQTNIHSFIGKRYKVEYLVQLDNQEIAKFECMDSLSKIYLKNREITIKSNAKYFTTRDYDILEHDIVIGRVIKPFWVYHSPQIKFENLKSCHFKLQNKGIFQLFRKSKDYLVEIACNDESIKYRFNKANYFPDEKYNQKYLAVNGQIEFDESKLLVALTGFLLIELTLYGETY